MLEDAIIIIIVLAIVILAVRSYRRSTDKDKGEVKRLIIVLFSIIGFCLFCFVACGVTGKRAYLSTMNNKPGSKAKVMLTCEITGIQFDMIVTVKKGDTPFSIEWRAKNQYKNMAPDEKQAWAAQLSADKQRKTDAIMRAAKRLVNPPKE